MGVSMSTLGGWAIIFSVAGYYVYRYTNDGRVREVTKNAAQRLERQGTQLKKDTKEKAKRLRSEAYSKDVEDPEKTSQAKSRPAKTTSASATATDVVSSSDDGVDNREFARQLANARTGTNFEGVKKNEQKKAKSIKQSRAREIDTANTAAARPSAPSSTAGADADDDESSIASPETRAVDQSGVSDMLEPKAAGPSVLRLTETDKVKQKQKKAKEPEKVETKKQRQNRQKAEAAKLAREDSEKDRKVAMEAQRRLARVSEGRAAQDGSAFVAAQQSNAWKPSDAKDNTGAAGSNGTMPVLPLDTFTAPPAKPATPSEPKKAPAAASKARGSSDDWMSSLPSEEEQLEKLLADEEWSTVTTKKSNKSKKQPTTELASGESSVVTAPQQLVPVVSKPAVQPQAPAQKQNSGRPILGQQSSFAALSTDEPEEEEEEWDV